MFWQKIKNAFKLYRITKDKVILTCLQNDIPLTDENIKHVREILENNKKREWQKEMNNINK